MSDFDVWFKSNDDPCMDVITICDRVGTALRAFYGEIVHWTMGSFNDSYVCKPIWGTFKVTKGSGGFCVEAYGRLNMYDVIGLSAVLETVFENDAYPFHVNYMGNELGYDLTSQTVCKGLKISEDWYMEIWDQDVAPALERL